MTRKMRAAILAGIATMAVAGTAVAKEHRGHVLTVALPDGSVEHIRYSGDVAPRVVIAPARMGDAGWALAPISVSAAPVAMPIDLFDTRFAPFALFDRIAADMARQADGMMRFAAAAQQAAPGSRLDMAAFDSLPAGTVHYSFVSTGTGQGVCSRSVEVTSLGAGKAPKMVSQTSGDCGGAPTAAGRAAAPAGAAAVTPVKLDRATPQPVAPAPDHITI